MESHRSDAPPSSELVDASATIGGEGSERNDDDDVELGVPPVLPPISSLLHLPSPSILPAYAAPASSSLGLPQLTGNSSLADGEDLGYHPPPPSSEQLISSTDQAAFLLHHLKSISAPSSNDPQHHHRHQQQQAEQLSDQYLHEDGGGDGPSGSYGEDNNERDLDEQEDALNSLNDDLNQQEEGGETYDDLPYGEPSGVRSRAVAGAARGGGSASKKRPRKSVEGEEAKMEGKRAQVKNACTNCQKTRKKCTGETPCSNCLKSGTENPCLIKGRAPRAKGLKRGPYKKRGELARPSQPPQPLPPPLPDLLPASLDHDLSHSHSHSQDELHLFFNSSVSNNNNNAHASSSSHQEQPLPLSHLHHLQPDQDPDQIDQLASSSSSSPYGTPNQKQHPHDHLAHPLLLPDSNQSNPNPPSSASKRHATTSGGRPARKKKRGGGRLSSALMVEPEGEVDELAGDPSGLNAEKGEEGGGQGEGGQGEYVTTQAQEEHEHEQEGDGDGQELLAGFLHHHQHASNNRLDQGQVPTHPLALLADVFGSGEGREGVVGEEGR